MNYTSEKGKNKEICTKEAKKEIYFQINIDKNQNKYYNEGGINIEIFTYKDYLQYKDLFSKKSEDNQKEETNGIEYNKKRNTNKYFDILAKNNQIEGKLQEISMLAEESAKYERVNNEHDKIFRTILGKKQEAVAFINKTIKTNIKIEEIEQIGNYNLVDVHDFTEKELLEENNFLSKMMLVEKAKNSDDIVSAIDRVLKVTKEEDRDLLKRIILIILNRKIGENEAYRLANKLKEEC